MTNIYYASILHISSLGNWDTISNYFQSPLCNLPHLSLQKFYSFRHAGQNPKANSTNKLYFRAVLTKN